MAKVRKNNRVITVDDNRVDSYLLRGYDQVDDKGSIIKYATGGKTVTIAEYNKLREEIERLSSVEVSNGGKEKELQQKLEDALKLNEKLTAKVKELEEDYEAVSKENSNLETRIKKLQQRN